MSVSKQQIQKIFQAQGLGEVKSYKKYQIGFTNQVYLVNNKFILKICGSIANEKHFRKEVYFYQLFKDRLPVPEVIALDESKKIIDQVYMIYPAIKGDNLYARWHLLSNPEMKNVFKQICDILMTISHEPAEEFIKKFEIKAQQSWQDNIFNQLKADLKIIANKKLLSADFIKAIKKYLKDNYQILAEEKMALVFWDAHFDNFIIKDKKIVGILDFERTDWSSIDYNLDVINRMVKEPHKYVSEESDKYIKDKDYADLLTWFKEFYPELFKFKNLEKRLDIYTLSDCLGLLPDWSRSEGLKNIISSIIKYKK